MVDLRFSVDVGRGEFTRSTQSSSIAMEHTYLLKMMESSLLYSDCRILQVCSVPVMFGVLDFIDSDG